MAESVVNEAIKGNKIMMFSKSYCPFCTKAKKALDDVGAVYAVMELDKRQDCNEIQDLMGKMTGARSVPRVFIDGKFVGGGDETVALKKSGKLAEMVA